METYDFRNTEIQERQEQFMQEVDNLTNSEMEELLEAFETIIANSKAKKNETSENYFNISVLPVLKDFAELTGSILEILRDEHNIITATFKNATEWTYEFEEQPKYDEDGHEIEYTIKETPVKGYTVSYEIE